MNKEQELLKRKFEREFKARIEAEKLLEVKSLELYKSNIELKRVNENQELIIQERTAALQASETNYQSLVESISDFICKTKLDGTITFVNKITSLALGFEIEDIIGKNIFDFVAPAYKKIAYSYTARLFLTRNCMGYIEFPLLSKDGKEKWLGNNIQFFEKKCLKCGDKQCFLNGNHKSIVANDCTFAEVIIVSRDISQQREAARIQKEQSVQLEKLLNQQVIISDTALALNSLESFDHKINQTLSIIGKELDASRVYIFENSEDQLTTSNSFEWCNLNIEAQISELHQIPYSSIPSWKSILLNQKIIH